MRLKGFLVIFLLVAVLVFFLWIAKKGGNEKIKQDVDAFNRVREQTTRTNMTSIKRAIDFFIAQNGRTPQSLSEVRTFRPSVYADSDMWGTTFKYVRISDSRYRLVSAGRDKTFDTQDDIVFHD
jgi:hypothetical protein